MAGNVESIYILCTGDEFELPLMIGTYRQIALYTGFKVNWLKWALCKKDGYFGGTLNRDKYRILRFPEEDELEEKPLV